MSLPVKNRIHQRLGLSLINVVFFYWIDEPTCPRSREFGQKVQEKISKLEAEIKELKTNESMMKTNKRQKNLVRMLLGS